MCGQFFCDKLSLLEHIQQQHYAFICLQCDYQSTEKAKLEEHEHIDTLNRRSVYDCKLLKSSISAETICDSNMCHFRSE